MAAPITLLICTAFNIASNPLCVHSFQPEMPSGIESIIVVVFAAAALGLSIWFFRRYRAAKVAAQLKAFALIAFICLAVGIVKGVVTSFAG